MAREEDVRILVTGGAGYVGSIVAAELLKAGYGVIVYDNFSRGHRQAVPPDAKLVVGDMADRPKLDQLLKTESVHAVLHFGAFLEVGESMRSPELYFRNNTAATLTLLEAMLAHGIRQLVFSSTAAVYGQPKDIPIKETHPLHPTNAYGESKLMVERMLDWFHRAHGLRYACLRYFNAAGSSAERGEDHRPESHLIPCTLKVALGQSDHVPIFGVDYATPDGTCLRDYIHVLDLAQAHLLALEALGQHARLVYNLGSGRGFSVRQVIETARHVTGHPIPATETKRRPGDPSILVACSQKFQRELKWRPEYPELEAIIASAWEWHQRHPYGYTD